MGFFKVFKKAFKIAATPFVETGKAIHDAGDFVLDANIKAAKTIGKVAEGTLEVGKNIVAPPQPGGVAIILPQGQPSPQGLPDPGMGQGIISSGSRNVIQGGPVSFGNFGPTTTTGRNPAWDFLGGSQVRLAESPPLQAASGQRWVQSGASVRLVG